MKKMKRTISLVLALALILANMCFVSFADEGIEFGWSVDTNEVSVGDDQYLNVSIDNPNQCPIAGFKIMICCDTDVFEVAYNEEDEEYLIDLNYGGNLGEPWEAEDGYQFVWYHTKNVSKEHIMDVSLKVKDDVVSGDYTISVKAVQASDKDLQLIDFYFSGEETIAVTGDITLADVTPTFTTQPSGVLEWTWNFPYDPMFTAEATVNKIDEDAEITYQWYKADSETGDGVLFSNAVGANCFPTYTLNETAYYYCVATSVFRGVTYTAESTRKEVVCLPAEIDTVSVAIEAPVKGAVAQTTVAATDEYTGEISWSPAVEGGKFVANTVYTATVKLTIADAHYKFAESVTVTDIGTFTTAADGTLTITKTFAATEDKVLTGIKVTTAPTKTEYVEGETFDKTGMVVTATYDDNSTAGLDEADYTVAPETLALDTESVTVSYGGKTATVAVTVVKNTLESIEVSGEFKKDYTVGDEADWTGMVVTATYKRGNTETVNAADYTVTGFDSSKYAESQTITVTYKDLTATFTIVIDRKTTTAADVNVTVPQDCVYDGNEHVAVANPAAGVGAVTIKYNGSTEAPKNAGTYVVTYSVAETDTHSAMTDVNAGSFTIAKAECSVTGLPESITVKVNGTSDAVAATVPADGAGAVSYKIDKTSIATLNADNKVVGVAVGSTKLIVTVAEGTNYKAKTVEIPVTVTELDPQEFADGFTTTVEKTYGDAAFTRTTSLTAGTGAIAYTSSNEAVATVNATTGEVTIIGAGETTITATAAKVDGEYAETSVSYSLVVAQKEVGLTWNNVTDRVYGDEKVVTATATGVVEGDTVTVTVEGGDETNAGTYTATATALNNANYKLPADKSVSYTIAKAKVDASDVEWNYEGAFTYNGAAFTVEVTGLPAGVTATYDGNTATNAGSYTASVVLTCTDSDNCEVEGAVAPLFWKIEKATAGELTDSTNVRYSDTADKTITADMIETLIGDTNAGVVITKVETATSDVMGAATLTDGVVTYKLNEGLASTTAGTTVELTISYTADNYVDGTVKYTVSVIDKNDVSDKLTFAAGSGTYTGEAHSYEKAKVASGYKGTITYSYSGNMTDAGTYTVTAIYEDEDNYGVATAEYVIKPASISISSVTVADKEYDATTAATIETVKFSGLKGEDTVDYTVVSAVYADANAGTSKKVTYEIALAESVINYTLSKGTGSVSNAKITAKPLTVEIADIAEQTYTGSAIQPEVVINFVGLMGEDQLTAGTNYTVKYADNVNAGEAKVTVTIKSSKNYTFEATEKTFVIAKATPVVTADNLTVGYTGAAVPAEKITGTATFNDKAIKGTWSWVEVFEGIELGEYADVKVLFTPENESLNAAECTIVVTIVKGIPEGEPSYTAVKASGKTLADAELGLGTLPEGGTIEWVVKDEETGEYVAVDPATVEVKSNVAYTWRYTPAADMAENYDVKIGTIVVWYVAPYVAPSYSITVAAAENGDVTADARSAEKGEVVTVTVAPADGYELDELTVVTADGTAVELTEVSEGVYTFVMPSAKVTVTATFVEAVKVEMNFSDVAEDDWFYSYVEYAFQNGLMNGISDTEFAPYGETSRAMIVTVLWRMEGEPVVNYLMQFEDVENDTWYTEAVRWAASEGIVNGYSDTAFGPTDAITREQMVTILYRYAQYKGYDVSVGEDTNILSYEDALTISEYAIPAMQWACGAGLIQGDGVNLTPKATANRAQVAALFQRFCENVAN